MRKIFFALFLMLVIKNTYCQGKDYDISTFKIYKIERINIWNIRFDKSGNKRDSSLMVFFYDTLGRKIIEKEIGKDGKCIDSTVFIYNVNGYLVGKESYSNSRILEGTYKKDSLKITNYDFQNKISNEVTYSYGGEKSEIKYYYLTLLRNNKGCFFSVYNKHFSKPDSSNLKNPDCPFSILVIDEEGIKYFMSESELIDFIDVYKNNSITGIIRYEYYFR